MRETGIRPSLSSGPLQPQYLLGRKFSGSQARPLLGCCFTPSRKILAVSLPNQNEFGLAPPLIPWVTLEASAPFMP